MSSHVVSSGLGKVGLELAGEFVRSSYGHLLLQRPSSQTFAAFLASIVQRYFCRLVCCVCYVIPRDLVMNEIDNQDRYIMEQ